MSEFILFILKYWRCAGAILCVLLLAGSLYLSHHRGVALQTLRQENAANRAVYDATIRALRQQKKQERSRTDFRNSQTRKFREAGHETLILDPELRDAYQRLRERQAVDAAY